jgi:probable addiction module antidote protein
MMKEGYSRWDVVEHLNSEEDIRMFWEACLDEGSDDPTFLLSALSAIARARNINQLARDTGLTRAGIYKALSPDGNPHFTTVMKIIHALGLQLGGRVPQEQSD